jgi:CMP-N,N'-diacetyllegionaminic acid synthase
VLDNQSIAVLIPARGGSKGIPRKNVQIFLGKPLIVHSIEYAKNCDLVDNVFVSTEDLQIGKIAEQAGAQILWRPIDLANDTATTESTIEHALEEIALCGSSYDIVVLLQATSPLRPKSGLIDALNDFSEGGFDSMLSLSPAQHFSWRIDGQDALAEYDYLQRPRRQDIEQKDLRYQENGSMYIFTKRHFYERGNRLGGRIGYTLFDQRYSYEIDSWEDFRLLEQIAKGLVET